MNSAGGGESAPVAPQGGTAETLTPGELLRRERERRALSVQQAAEDLHLDAAIVEAIEANKFAVLGAPVYARGHLRKYAARLGLSPEFVIQRYEALSDRPVVPTPVPPAIVTSVSVEQRSKPKWALWILGTLLALGIAAWLYGWLKDSGWLTAAPEAVSEPPVSSASTVEPAANAIETSTPTVQAGTQARTQAATASARRRPTASAAVPAAGEVRLRLEYNDSSWTEVYDATGRRLLFDMGVAGRVRTVSGTPPLRVTLGFASAVSAQVDDHPIVIPRQVGKDSARFAVTAEGAVSTARQLMSDEVSVE